VTQSMPDVTDARIAWDNYVDHACDRLPELPPAALRYAPLLVGVAGKGGALGAALKSLRSAIGSAQAGQPPLLLITPQEAALLDALIDDPGTQTGAEVFLYRQHDDAHGTSGGAA